MTDRNKPATIVAAGFVLAAALAGLAAISDGGRDVCPRHPVGKATLAPCQGGESAEARR